MTAYNIAVGDVIRNVIVETDNGGRTYTLRPATPGESTRPNEYDLVCLEVRPYEARAHNDTWQDYEFLFVDLPPNLTGLPAEISTPCDGTIRVTTQDAIKAGHYQITRGQFNVTTKFSAQIRALPDPEFPTPDWPDIAREIQAGDLDALRARLPEHMR